MPLVVMIFRLGEAVCLRKTWRSRPICRRLHSRI